MHFKTSDADREMDVKRTEVWTYTRGGSSQNGLAWQNSGYPDMRIRTDQSFTLCFVIYASVILITMDNDKEYRYGYSTVDFKTIERFDIPADSMYIGLPTDCSCKRIELPINGLISPVLA